MKPTTQVRRCPCCGCTDLWVGTMSVSSFGVKCLNCKIQVTRELPERWPPGLWNEKLTEDENMMGLYEWTLNKALKVWNRRSGEGKELFSALVYIV